jgi:hypothetical protein
MKQILQYYGAAAHTVVGSRSSNWDISAAACIAFFFGLRLLGAFETLHPLLLAVVDCLLGLRLVRVILLFAAVSSLEETSESSLEDTVPRGKIL